MRYPTTVEGPEESSLDALLDEAAHAPVYRQMHPTEDGPPVFVAEGEHGLPSTGEVVDGKYRIERVLGRGGMGVVFAATQLATDRGVALKWMHPHRLEGNLEERRHAAQRFAREARIAGRIDHPQAVEVFDVGGTPERPYLVMERLRGETLRERLGREGPLPWDEAVRLLRPVFGLLQAAHDAGVVHRDLKPDNLFLTRGPDGEEVARVLDFGIASLAEREPGESTLTRTGSVLGTPAYMPLEQLRGERELDARADVYSLAVVLYEVLSGEVPYTARNAADYAVALSKEPPTPLVRHAPGLDAGRQRAVMRGLSREREGRYATMREFLSAIEETSTDTATRRRRLLVVATLAVATIAGMGALSWTHGTMRPVVPVTAGSVRPQAPGRSARVPAAPEEKAAPEQPTVPEHKAVPEREERRQPPDAPSVEPSGKPAMATRTSPPEPVVGRTPPRLPARKTVPEAGPSRRPEVVARPGLQLWQFSEQSSPQPPPAAAARPAPVTSAPALSLDEF